jgi:hypothetical protein
VADPKGRPGRAGACLPCAAALALLAILLFKHLSYPLLWHDEAETAMFARRVLEYGYPVVRDSKNAVYSLWQRGGVGVHEASGAWTGTPWLQYYYGAIGVALADRVDDLYAKTARLRLPFAAAGFLGLLVWLGAVLPALGASRARRALFASLGLLLFGYSVSLLLHLREARYYPLVVLWTGCAVWLFCRHHVFGTLRSGAYAAGLTVVLVLLFNTFYPAFAVLLTTFGLHHAARAWRRPGPPGERLAWLLRAGLPLFLAGASALLLLGFFDFAEQARGWLARFASPGAYARNLEFVGAYLVRFELLAPALVLRGTALALRPPDAALDPALRARLEIAGLLALLGIVYALLVAQTPFLFERYFIALSPLLTVLLLLDAFSVADLLRLRQGLARRAGAVGAALAVACGLASLWARVPEFRGRLQEIRVPYRGPLDYVIPYLKQAHARPDELVIATNYEEPAYMFYLGSRVTVGFYGADLERDLAIVPDVIVPRPWPDHVEVLRALSERASYAAREFPVENLRWNNSPALMGRGAERFAHRFRTPEPEGRLPLVILERQIASEPARSP